MTLADILPTLDGMKTKPRKKSAINVKVGNIKVTIYKRERATSNGKTRTIFEVADYTTGTRRLRGFGEEADARREAEKIARQLATGETTAAMMRNSDAASYGRATELIKPTGASLEHCASVYAKIYEILGGDYGIEAANFFKIHRADKLQQRTVADVVADLLVVKSSRTKRGKPASPRYIGDLRARLTTFANAFACPISSITTSDVQNWFDKLECSPQTAKNYRTVLDTLFGFAEKRGYIFKGGNPIELTEDIATAEGGAITIYTPDEMAALLKAANEVRKDFLPMVAIGGFAGLRTAEIERLDWSNIDFAGASIEVGSHNSKTRSRRFIPITPNLAQWLAPYANEKGKVWKGTPDTLRDARSETVTSAKKLSEKIEWKPNGLRHSFISYRLADIQKAAQVALEAGNSEDMVFKHYRKLVNTEAAKAWFNIEPKTAANVVTMGKVAA